MVHDVWVEVDAGALRHNLRQVQSRLAAGVSLMAVVKANGYGHGCVEASRVLVEAGARYLGVTRLEEALAIREAGISAPILLFAPIQPENADLAVRNDLEMTVVDAQALPGLYAAAQKLGKTARLHIKVDTGMGRLGLPPKEALQLVKAIGEQPGLEAAGIYTHFATAAEKNLDAAHRQLKLFQDLIEEMDAAKIKRPAAHAANSASFVRVPESHFDMVRVGTLLYGQYPSEHVPRVLDLKPTWKLKARVCQIRELRKGSAVGYGSEYVADKNIRTAVIPVGFADGFTLSPEGPIYRQSLAKFAGKKMCRSLSVEVRGRKAGVIGRVGMQLTVIDVTGIEGVSLGDVVVIPAMRIPTSALIARVYVDSSG